MDVTLEFTNETEEKENIIECLNVLYSTPVGSVSLDRDFGMDWSFLDLPMPAAKARFESELIQKTQKYEKRIRVLEIKWGFDAEKGKMTAKVVIEIV